MIVQSFRSVLWVGAVAGAAISCYMVSLRVAAERASLERVETDILIAKRDIRSLDTELTTRGRLRQLERWNSDVLALTAPTEGQFLEGEVQLANLGRVDPKIMPGDDAIEEEGERFMHAVAAPPAETQARPILADYTPTPSDARLVKASVTKTSATKKANTRPAAEAKKKRAEPAKPKAATRPKIARDDAAALARKPAKKAAALETAAVKKRGTATVKTRETAAVANKKAKAKTTT